MADFRRIHDCFILDMALRTTDVLVVECGVAREDVDEALISKMLGDTQMAEQYVMIVRALTNTWRKDSVTDASDP